MLNDIQLPSNKKFGLSFSLIFFVVSIIFFFKNIYLFFYFFLFLAIILIPLSILLPNYLSVLNRTWMTFGLLLSKIMNPLVLGVIFFGLITPIGLLRKLIGKDELNLKKESKQTFWNFKDSETYDANSFKDQF